MFGFGCTGSFLSSIIGFLIGLFVFRSFILAIVFMFVGSALFSGLGNRYGTSGGSFFNWGAGANSELFNDNLFSMLGRLAPLMGKLLKVKSMF